MKILRVCFAENPHHLSGVVNLVAPLWDDKPWPKQRAEITSQLECRSFVAATIDEDEISLEQLKEMIR